MTIETTAMAIRINRSGREKPLKKQAIPMHMAKSARKTKKPAFCRSDQSDKLCLSEKRFHFFVLFSILRVKESSVL